MSKELVKWRLPESEAGRKIDAALARYRAGEIETRRGQSAASYAPSRAGGVVVDLPRICAVHDKPYAARYVTGADGRSHYSQSIQITESLWEGQYRGEQNIRFIPVEQLGDESCPWCGAHSVGWTGPVSCTKCGAKVCFGRTAKNYFRCRPSCNKEGSLRGGDTTDGGVTPSCRGGYGGV
jgi:hypothetical protein